MRTSVACAPMSGAFPSPKWRRSWVFQLPLSARMHRPWWANQSRGNGHSHALAWTMAGWETAAVDMEG